MEIQESRPNNYHEICPECGTEIDHYKGVREDAIAQFLR